MYLLKNTTRSKKVNLCKGKTLQPSFYEQLPARPSRGAETGYNGYKLYRTNCLLSDSLGLENTRNLSDVGGRSAENTRNLSDSAVSSCPTVRQCYVQLSNG